MKIELFKRVLPVSLALSLVACGGGSQPIPRPASGTVSPPRSTPHGAEDDDGTSHVERDAEPEPSASRAEEPAKEVSTPGVPYEGPTGSISGVVDFKGDAPERRELAIGGTAGCEHDGTPLTEVVIVNGGKLENVFVYVSKGLKDYPVAATPEPLNLDQRGCMYSPHVSGALVGQTIRASNSDPVSHNVHVIAKRNDSPNKTQSAGMKPLEIEFAHEEVPVTFVCDIHPWMKAYVCVQEHPFFAVSDAAGAFEIPGLPPGKYSLTAWHEKYGKKKSGSVDVAPDGAATVRFEYP